MGWPRRPGDEGVPGFGRSRYDGSPRGKTPAIRQPGKRSHKSRALLTLPKHGLVDMSTAETDWHPRCLLVTGKGNVSMEATVENFKKLFGVVHAQVRELAAQQPAEKRTPARTPRRAASDPHDPKGSPESRMYYIAEKGWVKMLKQDMLTPGSGSGSSKAHNNKRRCLRGPGLGRTLKGSRPHAAWATHRDRAPWANKRLTSTRVLSHDDDAPLDTNGGSSSEDDPFGQE